MWSLRRETGLAGDQVTDLSGLSARQTASPSQRVDGVPAEGSSQVACVLDHRVVRLGVDVPQRLVEVEAVLLKHN